MSAAIETRDVVKRYGSLEAVAGASLEIPAGEVFALLGPNGAGKTTFVEILEGFRRRTAGEARVLGTDPEAGDLAWRARVGVVFQSAGYFDALTPRELLRHFAGFYPNPLDPDTAIAMVGLEEKRDTRIGKLSGGQKRRADLALGLIGDPKLLFLDEPTTGLDPEGRRQAWAVTREFAARGRTVLLTTHYLDEAEHLADRVGIIVRGRIVELGPPHLIGGRERELARVTVDPPPGLPRPPGDWQAHPDGRLELLTPEPTAVVVALARWAEAQGCGEVPGLEVRRPTLEDIYLRLVREHGGNGEAAG